jgi:hypothetical protein
MPKRQALEDQRIVESNVERKNHGPGEAKPSVIVRGALLLAETRTLERDLLALGHSVPLEISISRMGLAAQDRTHQLTCHHLVTKSQHFCAGKTARVDCTMP